MNKEYMSKLFDVLSQIDDLAEPVEREAGTNGGTGE